VGLAFLKGGSVDIPPLSPYPDDMATRLASETWIAGERRCVVPGPLALGLDAALIAYVYPHEDRPGPLHVM